MTLPSDDEAVLAANERIPRAGIFSGLLLVQSWRCRCGDTAGRHLGDASPPGWKQVRCGFAGEVWLCPSCQADRSQRARRGATTKARRKRGCGGVSPRSGASSTWARARGNGGP